MYYLGIDISKKSFTVSILDEKGEAITKFLTFPCTRKGAEKLVDKISSLKLEKNKVSQSLSNEKISPGAFQESKDR